MSYVSIIAKDFGQGTVCIVSDTFSGYRSGHGKSSVVLWRKILELTGHAQLNEPIYVALIDYRDSDYDNKLYELSPIIVDRMELDQLLARPLSQYDVIFFAGLPPEPSDEIKSKMADWVRNGGGILIECPNVSGTIQIISDLEQIEVESIQRPFDYKAYWTNYGRLSGLYTESATVSTMISIDKEQLSSGWNVYMSNIPTIYDTDVIIPVPNGKTSGLYTSRFIVSTGCYFNNGIVTLEEFNGSSSSESSSGSSSESSIIEESSSSSQIEDWNVCDSILAQWKMNDNAGNNVIDDSEHNILNVAYLYRAYTPRKTSYHSIVGRTSSALLFNGTNDYAKTVKTSRLRMNDGTTDEEFSLTCWVSMVKGKVGPIICKKSSWEVGIKNSGNTLYFKKIDDDGKEIEFSGYIPNFNTNIWTFIVVNCYDNAGLTADLYVNQDKLTVTTVDQGYSGINTQSNELFMASDSSSYIESAIDNVMIFSRKLTDIEIEGLYNRGNGTENCEGLFYYTSSSSTSTSSADSSSSSVGNSSSSSSSIGNSSSSSSS